MNSKKCLMLLAAAFFSFFSQAQQKKITWSETPLTWQDFEGDPDSKSDYSANVNSGISYTWTFSTETGEPVLVYEVSSSFYPELSWKKQTINDPDYLLKHEQTHFDISELHARKLRKALENYQVGRNVRQDLKKIYQKIERERVKMQQQFDFETSHSENRDAELKWREFVSKELQNLQEYAS